MKEIINLRDLKRDILLINNDYLSKGILVSLLGMLNIIDL